MDKNLKKVLVSIVLVVSLISVIDILFMSSGIFGTPSDYTNGNYTCGLWPLFEKLVLGIMVLFSVLYFFYYHKDKSEAIAIFGGSYIFWRSGASDLFYFLLQFKSVPDFLPWLNNNFPLNIFGPVTNLTLYSTVFIGGIVTYFACKFLKEKL
jgi:uncharacterized membrane protein